jgi:DNA anti-recombination protein RmuC
MATIADRLIQLKTEIDQAKLDKASVEGQLKQNLARLKDEFQCRSVEQANGKLKALKEQKETLTKQLEVSMAKLEEDFQW